ncbi:hypothetical protein L5515_003433 [Caenorhabditis briggsae]|uniref:Uncharacterized protein n=1 Tax=Caenorhabditis briggsae TaxID=6238 RepID=A0AAE9EIJ0_CAEBR|nr:hypothetical protein L5515_003433 [Caenorhabditis briggsae]
MDSDSPSLQYAQKSQLLRFYLRSLARAPTDALKVPATTTLRMTPFSGSLSAQRTPHYLSPTRSAPTVCVSHHIVTKPPAAMHQSVFPSAPAEDGDSSRSVPQS